MIKPQTIEKILPGLMPLWATGALPREDPGDTCKTLVRPKDCATSSCAWWLPDPPSKIRTSEFAIVGDKSLKKSSEPQKQENNLLTALEEAMSE